MTLAWRLLIVFVLMLASLKNASAFVYEGLDIKISGAINEMYNDNITSATEEEKKKEDFITNLTLGLGIKYEGKAQHLEFTGRMGQDIFGHYNNLNSNSQNLNLNYQNELTGYDKIRLDNTYSHTYEPEGFEDEFGRTTGRYSSYTNTFTFGYIREVSEKLSLDTRYTNQQNWFLREDLKNSYQNSLGIEADYSPNLSTAFLLSYSFAQTQFKDGDSASTQTIAIGGRQYMTKQLYINGRAGYDFMTSYNDEDYNKPFFEVSLTEELDKNTIMKLSYKKRYQTPSTKEDLFNSWQTSAVVSRELLKGFNGSLSGFYGEGEYSASDVIEEFHGTNISFTYDFKENLRGNLAYTYTDADTTYRTGTVGYRKNTVNLGLSLDF